MHILSTTTLSRAYLATPMRIHQVNVFYPNEGQLWRLLR